jgi:hypothetical protein
VSSVIFLGFVRTLFGIETRRIIEGCGPLAAQPQISTEFTLLHISLSSLA